MAPWALLRGVPDSFAACVTRRPTVPPLDPARARRQHAGYRAALESGGFATSLLPGDEAFRQYYESALGLALRCAARFLAELCRNIENIGLLLAG